MELCTDSCPCLRFRGLEQMPQKNPEAAKWKKIKVKDQYILCPDWSLCYDLSKVWIRTARIPQSY